MKTTTLIRTETGYRYGDTEVQIKPLSPREAQFTALAAAGHSRAESCEMLGIKHGSAHRLAQRLYYKLNTNNMLASLAEARKRGYLRHYAVLLLTLFSMAQPHIAARPPRPPVRTASTLRLVREYAA